MLTSKEIRSNSMVVRLLNTRTLLFQDCSSQFCIFVYKNSTLINYSRPSLLDEPSEFGARSGSPFGDEKKKKKKKKDKEKEKDKDEKNKKVWKSFRNTVSLNHLNTIPDSDYNQYQLGQKRKQNCFAVSVFVEISELIKMIANIIYIGELHMLNKNVKLGVYLPNKNWPIRWYVYGRHLLPFDQTVNVVCAIFGMTLFKVTDEYTFNGSGLHDVRHHRSHKPIPILASATITERNQMPSTFDGLGNGEPYKTCSDFIDPSISIIFGPKKTVGIARISENQVVR